MAENAHLNANRFLGFADVYDGARPQCPEKVKEFILAYLGGTPSLVVDLGCGTGLSTTVWHNVSDRVIGIEPSADMLRIARGKSAGLANVEFVAAFSDHTGLKDGCADIVTCSQSFHWMNPETTLPEVSRILRDGGVFAAYDCDWPPVCHWEAELAYNELFAKVAEMEAAHPELKAKFRKWDKDKHLANIQTSGKFRYAREIVFSHTETCDAKRLLGIALSQGGLQSVLKANQEEIRPYLAAFEERITANFGSDPFPIDFCYRLRLGVK